MEPRYRQESIIIRAHRPEEPADIRRVKTSMGLTGSPNQKGIGQIPTKIISPSLGRVKKEILSRPGSDILTSQGQGCLAMSRHMTKIDEMIKSLSFVHNHQRTKTERQAKGTQEGGNGQKGKTTSHPDGPTMGESSQAKDVSPETSRHDGRFPTQAEHRLNVPVKVPYRQKKRGQAPERNKAIQEEVEKLVDAGIMKEVHYHSWLSNPVMVKKHDGSWRMCVDFKDLNKACPQDGYPLPEIDWKVESLCGYPFKCFLDAYKGYHQIKMAKEDEEKTAFITNQGIFCYSKMPFGLKNAGATYQRLVDKAFQRQIGRNLEVYVDDLVIKSRTEEEIIRDIAETFKTLRQINMKLNPKKCTFGMQEGMFLGYKVNTDGLKVCPDKADAVLSLPSPRCLKDVQKLNGKLASLNRRGQGGHQCSLNDRKGRQTNTSVLCEPRPTRAGDQLQPHGKIGVSRAQCKQAAEKILPSIHNRCNHGSADKATIVKLRNQWEDAKVEV
ncbi:reverse transcriptase domain-containing protein [Tanacetum coccineum]